MRFDYTSKPAHPRKILKLASEFINANVSYSRPVEYIITDLSNEEFFKRLREGDFETEIVKEKVTFKITNGAKSCAWLGGNSDEARIEINFPELNTIGSQVVRENAISRSKTLNGFSHFLQVLLHEVGHFMTEEEAEKSDLPRTEEPDLFDTLWNSETERDFEEIMQGWYVKQPDEFLATEWAINFLKNAENRKNAKKFEREFFKLWRG